MIDSKPYLQPSDFPAITRNALSILQVNLGYEKVMCRNTLSVDWRGFVYDCDFNQMLKLPLGAEQPIHINQVAELRGQPIATLQHCYACTAGQ